MDDQVTGNQGVSISLRSAVRVYLVIFGVLLVLNLIAITLKELGHGYALGFVPTFNFDGEENVPTLFSVFLILQAAVVCLVISKQNAPGQNYWLALSIIFTLLAVDEYFSFHEKLMSQVRSSISVSGFFYYVWIVPYGILVLILGIVLLRWLWQLPDQTKRGFIVSALLYLTGALLFEGFAGLYLNFGDKGDFALSLLSTIEESLEMLGLMVFTYYAVKYLLAESGAIRFEVSE